ncbi:TonB family protein [Pseudomaricurvus alkylphenolicus]|jgi:protein TonB|uniref:energy transducer TonB n=1 Tax=Pseudomaricurvus alkylphenolicus TaxID=1306991 RepID=UPI0014240012|nr:energy transducer TonB [Pseudomaricurvus alkylphenolicus]NIB45231.1 TonB family protein [Pseudomaricurvus alkylphenolicus]
MKVILVLLISFVLLGCQSLDNSCNPKHRDYLLIENPEPKYPREAYSQGVEGWSVVSVTITTDGSTKDIRVIDAEPKAIFDIVSIKAASKMEFLPRIIACQAIEVYDVQYKYTFEIADSA